jgi:hypothetical protein
VQRLAGCDRRVTPACRIRIDAATRPSRSTISTAPTARFCDARESWRRSRDRRDLIKIGSVELKFRAWTANSLKNQPTYRRVSAAGVRVLDSSGSKIAQMRTRTISAASPWE